MDCKQATILIRAALDAGCAGAPPPSVQAHMSVCERCRLLWDEEAAIEETLRALSEDAEPEFPAGLHTQIMRALESRPRFPQAAPRPRPAGHFWSIGRLGLGAAAALMLTLVAGWPLLDRPPVEPASGDNLIPFSFESVLTTLNPAPLFEAPREDFKLLANSILSATGGILEPTPEPSSTPSAK